MGQTCVKHWSKLQANITLSSGESELVALVKGVSEGLGMQSLAADLGMQAEGGLYTDATAANGMVQRRGLGKAKHIDVGMLWVQERLRNKLMSLAKIDGTLNSSDILTKNTPVGNGPSP